MQNLINRIYSALAPKGKIFITIPDFGCAKKWNTFKNNKKVAEGTYSPMSGPEKGFVHSFFTKAEIQKLFTKFSDAKMHLDKMGRWVVQASK